MLNCIFIKTVRKAQDEKNIRMKAEKEEAEKELEIESAKSGNYSIHFSFESM
jgi:hypothetical protein